MSLCASSDDLWSSEFSELEKLSCLHANTVRYSAKELLLSNVYLTQMFTHLLMLTLPVSHWERKR